MAIKWYGFWRSLASNRVRTALALKGLQAEEVSINLLPLISRGLIELDRSKSSGSRIPGR